MKSAHSKKRVVTFDRKPEVKEASLIEELSGTLVSGISDKKLMRSILENDKDVIEDGKLIADAINQGLSSFAPEMLFEHLVKNYSLAKNIFGESLIRRITGYDEACIQRNIGIPEFQRELKKAITNKMDELKEKGLIDEEGINDAGVKLASVILCIEELDNLLPKGVAGEKLHKKSYTYGIKGDVKGFRKERYRDIAIRKTIKKAIRRSHRRIDKEDLLSFERKSRGQCFIIYALDASGSMKGEKIARCKKAGMVLAYKAIDERDKVGIIVFGSKVKKSIPPTENFAGLVKEIMDIRAATETNIPATIHEAVKLFPTQKATKHLILITDALPTTGDKPEDETLEAVSYAAANNITVSLVGINLEEKGKRLAEQIAELGQGRLYVTRDLEELNAIVLEDYYSVA